MHEITISFVTLAVSTVCLTSYSLLIYGGVCYYNNNGVNRTGVCENIYISGLLMSTFVTGSLAIYGIIKLGECLSVIVDEPEVVVAPTKKIGNPLRVKRILSSNA